MSDCTWKAQEWEPLAQSFFQILGAERQWWDGRGRERFFRWAFQASIAKSNGLGIRRPNQGTKRQGWTREADAALTSHPSRFANPVYSSWMLHARHALRLHDCKIVAWYAMQRGIRAWFLCSTRIKHLSFELSLVLFLSFESEVCSFCWDKVSWIIESWNIKLKCFHYLNFCIKL